jgi:hypothetical protein
LISLCAQRFAAVRTANPDVDDRIERLASKAALLAAMNARGKGLHLRPLRADRLRDIGAPDHVRAAREVPERNMHYGPVFGRVYLVAGEHAPPRAFEIGRAGKRNQAGDDFLVDAIFRKIEKKARRLDCKSFSTAGIAIEGFAH